MAAIFNMKSSISTIIHFQCNGCIVVEYKHDPDDIKNAFMNLYDLIKQLRYLICILKMAAISQFQVTYTSTFFSISAL